MTYHTAWRTSEKANELREFIDKNLKPKKPGIGGLERELIIDFVAKEIQEEIKKAEQRGRVDYYDRNF